MSENVHPSDLLAKLQNRPYDGRTKSFRGYGAETTGERNAEEGSKNRAETVLFRELLGAQMLVS